MSNTAATASSVGGMVKVSSATTGVGVAMSGSAPGTALPQALRESPATAVATRNDVVAAVFSGKRKSEQIKRIDSKVKGAEEGDEALSPARRELQAARSSNSSESNANGRQVV